MCSISKFKITLKSLKIYPKAINTLTGAYIQATVDVGEQSIQEIKQEQMMPFRSGYMQEEKTFVDASRAKQGHVTIVHDTPYARRLYYHPEYNFNQSINANAQGEWWKDWMKGGKRERFSKLFKNAYRLRARGYVK